MTNYDLMQQVKDFVVACAEQSKQMPANTIIDTKVILQIATQLCAVVFELESRVKELEDDRS